MKSQVSQQLIKDLLPGYTVILLRRIKDLLLLGRVADSLPGHTVHCIDDTKIFVPIPSLSESNSDP